MQSDQPESAARRRVAVIGAGFAGLWAVKRLRRECNLDIVLIDRNNYHTFLPLLYQVAAAELEPGQIAYPVRGLFRRKSNVTCMVAEALRVDLDERVVYTDAQPVFYDYLVFAPGSGTAFFGVPGAERHAHGLKTLEEALTLRNKLLQAFERAALEPVTSWPEGLLDVIVVGAGATGVEYAGALAELMRGPLRKDFPQLAQREPRVILVDGVERPVAGFAPRLREYVAKKLGRKGVTLRLGSNVAEVTPDGVRLQNGEFIPSRIVVWTAGVQGEALAGESGFPLGRGRRVRVLPTLQAEGYPEVFVAGDISVLPEKNPPEKSPPMVAPNAVQQGAHSARNILRLMRGETPEPFRYRDKGAMVTIGRGAAVAQIASLKFTGLPAWMLWLTVHITYLMGFRNRVFVFLAWAWDYFLFERAVRLILPREKPAPEPGYDRD